MRMRDEVGAIYDDAASAHLFPRRGQAAEAPWRLALVTVFQFAEGLPERPAADAVRGRSDWKYALALELADPGFDHAVLSEFRGRLVAGGAGHVAVGFERRTATCPAGHESAEWVPRLDNRGNDGVYIRFSAADCGPCPSRAKCTASRAQHPRRSLAVRPEPRCAGLGGIGRSITRLDIRVSPLVVRDGI